MTPLSLLLSGGIFEFLSRTLDKIFPDPEQKAQAQAMLVKLQNDGELDALKVQLSAIIAEAQSTDKWTSRARPSFLYVVYALLLMAIPMGVVYAVSPVLAGDITTGFKAWLASIPEPIVELFKWVMLGYIGGRSWEKAKRVA